MATEVLKKLDLAQGALGEDLLTEDIGDLLDGNALAGLVVDGGAAVWRNGGVVSMDNSACGEGLFRVVGLAGTITGGARVRATMRTTRYRRRPGPIPWSRCSARPR